MRSNSEEAAITNVPKSIGEEKSNEDDIYDEEGIENKKDITSPKIKYGHYPEDNLQKSLEKEHDNIEVTKEEINFFGINKTLYKKQDLYELPKTGTDFVLLPKNPDFIDYSDPFEPVYVPKQNILEETLKREAEKICFHETLLNRVVFDCVDQSFYLKNANPKDYDMDILPFYIPTSKDDITLVFESRFESGNLRRAIQIYDYEYNLILKPDYFTRGHTQWYYFSIANTRKDKEYRFNIINMMKPDSLYNCGMKPLLYSESMAKTKKIGWHRDGYDICYYQNNMKRRNAGYYYTLTFAVKFKHDHDTVYFAHCYPYTYTQLTRFLKSLEEDNQKKTRFRRKPLCQTLAGNNCDQLVITNFSGDIDSMKDKKGIFITSRVHPGESNSSFVVEGIIKFLVGNSLEAKILRDNFIFKLSPRDTQACFA